ncbi:MAG: class I SAM-dependent methyltransferase [Vicinamibacteria bacterium]|jgi:SAM-dependent methyltransferase|nr:class I SAM-dependent methyltransferase [Vicinamibacteria bacterium]
MSASFRDPAGFLVAHEGRLLRVVTDTQAAAELPRVLAQQYVRAAIASGQMVTCRLLTDAERNALPNEIARGAQAVVEHERLPMPSYPYEWPAEMLWAAAERTLDLALGLLDSGYGLKDATPYNVLFRGAQAVFVDLLSIERRDPGDYAWLPHAQFVRTFLLPLLAQRDLGWSYHALLLARRDGLEPQDLYRLLGPIQRFWPPYLGLCSLPTWLTRSSRRRGQALYRQHTTADPERARFILENLFGRLRRALTRARPRSGRRSTWSGYMGADLSYDQVAFRQKEAFVQSALRQTPPRCVLDIGCNTGHFSLMAARAGAGVMAIDSDAVVVGELYRRAREEKAAILPLVIDIARPSPAAGWRNQEQLSFLERADKRSDLVLALAVVHHLQVSERIPLPAIAELLARLTTRELIVEYVGPRDPRFQEIARGRDALYRECSAASFEVAFAPHFEIREAAAVADLDRRLYRMTVRGEGRC